MIQLPTCFTSRATTFPPAIIANCEQQRWACGRKSPGHERCLPLVPYLGFSAVKFTMPAAHILRSEPIKDHTPQWARSVHNAAPMPSFARCFSVATSVSVNSAANWSRRLKGRIASSASGSSARLKADTEATSVISASRRCRRDRRLPMSRGAPSPACLLRHAAIRRRSSRIFRSGSAYCFA